VSGEIIRKYVFKAKKQISPCIDGLRYEHLRALLGNGNELNQGQQLFAEELACLCSKIVDAAIPDSVFSHLRDTAIFGGPKPTPGDVRPIGKTSTLRKLCSKICFHHISERLEGATNFNERYFKGRQYALTSLGTEKIIHSIRLAQELHPEKCVAALDGKDAFHLMMRMKGLSEVQKHFPDLLPFIRGVYGEDSRAWFHGCESGINYIASREGFHQGDVLATWLYSLSIQPFIIAAEKTLGVTDFVKFFVDDGNILADFDQLVSCLKCILTEGPSYGYQLNMLKGSYLIGKCGYEVASQRKQILVDLGLSSHAFHNDADERVVRSSEALP
jgi:hypothetical protein